MSYTANKIQKKLLTELANYINTQYFGKTPLLLSALSERLKDENILHKEPYIESSAAYKTIPNGFEKINLRLAEKIFPASYTSKFGRVSFAVRSSNSSVGKFL